MALPTKLVLEVVTPDRLVLREDVDEVVVPGSEGELGVLPGHTPLLATLKVGEKVIVLALGHDMFDLEVYEVQLTER